MSAHKLKVGAIVRLARMHVRIGAKHHDYRIEQLVPLKDGGTLYKIKSEAEPFDRIVCEGDLAEGR